MLILKLRRGRVRNDGVRSVVPLVRTKTRKYGPVLDEKALSVKTDWLVLTAVDSRTNPASTAGTAQHDLDLVNG